MGGNLIRGSHERKDVEETDSDATSCQQPDTRHTDELFLLDQSAAKAKSGRDMKEAVKTRRTAVGSAGLTAPSYGRNLDGSLFHMRHLLGGSPLSS